MRRSLRRSGLVMAVCLLAGCGGGLSGKAGRPAAKPEPVQRAAPAKPVSRVSPVPGGAEAVPAAKAPAVAGCDRELKALKRLDAKRYALRRGQFDRLMSGAAVYADIRTEVAGSTREAVDAMYRFRTGKLCTEISRDVLDALARQGEVSGQ